MLQPKRNAADEHFPGCNAFALAANTVALLALPFN